MKYLFFDTETSGLPKNGQYNAPHTRTDIWPRLVQLAWLLTDEEGTPLSQRSLIVCPDGFEIPAEASKVHGITTEYAREHGVTLFEALHDFEDVRLEADVLVAHNTPFDLRVVGAEYVRSEAPCNWVDDMLWICTMREATQYCAIPGRHMGEYKWPRLTELHVNLFDNDFADAHDALADVRACARCFFELIDRGVITPPSVGGATTIDGLRQENHMTQTTFNEDEWEDVTESEFTFWNPEDEGDAVVGVYTGDINTKFGSVPLLLNSDDDKIALPAHSLIQRLFKDLSHGDLVRVTFKGIKETSTGNELRIYKVQRRKQEASQDLGVSQEEAKEVIAELEAEQ